MSVNDKIQSIAQHLEDAYTEISNKGGTIPAHKNMANLADAIESIQGGTATVKLFAPSLAFGTFTETNNPLIITNSQNGSFIQNYDIYSSETLLATIIANITSNVINLRNYFSTDGHYTIRVIAKNSSMQNSDAATIIYRYGTYITVDKTIVHGSITDDATPTTAIGGSYHATITPNTGYSFVGASVSVVMDGIDVTSTAYDGKYDISIANITGDIEINVVFSVMTYLSEPEISLDGDILTITPVEHAESYMLRLNGVDFIDVEDFLEVDLSEIFAIDGTYTLTVCAVAEGYYSSYDSNALIYVVNNGWMPDSILENNSWATIRIVSENGDASNYWAIGDTKGDFGEDGNTRNFRIVDMQGLYGKHVVFEEVECEGRDANYGYAWNTQDNIDDDGKYNNYSISLIRNTYLPTIMEKFSFELKNVITATTYKVAKNSSSSIVLELTDKLFLAANKEIRGQYNDGFNEATQEEFNALDQFDYYALNSDIIYREKKNLFYNSTANWILRSPSKYLSSAQPDYEYVCIVRNDGSANIGVVAFSSARVAPCFSF